MNKKTMNKLSLILLIGGLVFLVLAYFCFHYVTDDGITLTWHPEAGKPFVTILIGFFGVNCLFGSALAALSSYLFFPAEKKDTDKE